MVTEPLWLPVRGRSKATGGTERVRFTLTWVDVMLARLWKTTDDGEEEGALRQRGSEDKVIEPVESLGRKRSGMNT